MRELLDAFRRVTEHSTFAGGPFVASFERDFATFCGVSHAMGVGSGTDALRFTLLVDLDGLKKDSSEEKERIRLNAQFEREINAEQIARKRQLSMEEKNAVLVRMLKPVKVKAVSTWWGGNTMDKRYYQVEYKGNVIVPDETKAIIIKGFESRGIRYTNDMIIDAYLATQEK